MKFSPGVKPMLRVAFARHIRHIDRAEMRQYDSECCSASAETGFDFGPIVDGNLAGLVKGFATGEFLLVPMWGLDVAGQFGLIHGRGKAELTAGLGFLHLDAAEDGFLEVSRTTKKLVFGWRHFELMQKLLLNQNCCTNQVGNLEEFVSGWFDTLRKFDRRQEPRREYAMEEIRDGGLPTVVVDFDTVKFLQFRMPVPEKGKLSFDFVDNLFGRIDKLLIDDESMIREVCFANEPHHKSEYLCPKLPTQNGEFIRLPYDGPCVKTHTLNSKTTYARVKLIGQGFNCCRLVVKHHCEKVKARGCVRLVKNPGFINENAQHSFAQATSSENISDGNCFSSLKAKNILRFSVIPSFRKTSIDIIANFLGGCKGTNQKTKYRMARHQLKEVA